MRDISLFDVIGPNMIGPSSSHTAGALRISNLASRMVQEEIKQVDFILYGSFAKTYKGHGTDRALLAGIMGFDTEDERIRDSFEIANKKGLKYEFIADEKDKSMHPNTVRMKITTKTEKKFDIVGESIGGGNIQITEIDNVKLQFTGEYSTLIITNIDHAGVVAYVTNVLTKENINIAFMRTYREERGQKACTIIEADEKIDKSIIPIILQNKDILEAKIIEM